MRNDQLPKQSFKLMLEGTKEAIAKYWQSILTAISRYGSVTKFDAQNGTVFITGEGNMLTLAGKLKDALKSIYFGLDISVSMA